jgi:glycosyltransferase involved in cell wall biosynthesis
MTKQLTSIVIPVKNRANVLAETLESTRAQTSADFEVIIVDDGSVDDTIAIGRGFDKLLPSLKLIRRDVVRPNESGAQVCRNIGIDAALGNYVLFLDSDDLLTPHCIEHRMQYLNRHPELAFAVWQGTKFDEIPKPDDEVWAEWQFVQDDLLLFLQNKIPWQTTGPLWRSAALRQLGGWDEDLVSAGHDYEFHVRALSFGLDYHRVPIKDYHWRRPRTDSLSSFESFKAHHRSGAHITAFVKALEIVERANKLTEARKLAAWQEAVRLASQCLLFGGDKSTARGSLDSARKWRCVGTAEFLEAMTCIAFWGRVAGRVPSLWYISKRKWIRV